jgi:uncharacterized protein YoxC
MSANAGSVASGMKHVATNLGTIATSVDEMSRTIGEIASKSEQARVITHQAEEHADRVSGLMESLARAAREIGKVTETITGISEQTRLLALNATHRGRPRRRRWQGILRGRTRDQGTRPADVRRHRGYPRQGGRHPGLHVRNACRPRTDRHGHPGDHRNRRHRRERHRGTIRVTKDIARNVNEAVSGVQDAHRTGRRDVRRLAVGRPRNRGS